MSFANPSLPVRSNGDRGRIFKGPLQEARKPCPVLGDSQGQSTLCRTTWLIQRLLVYGDSFKARGAAEVGFKVRGLTGAQP